MGICFECEISLNGSGNVRACLVEVADGMTVQTPGGELPNGPTR